MTTKEIIFNDTDFPIRVFGNFQTHNKKNYIGKMCPMHFHDEYEFLYIKSGCLRCVTDNDEYFAYPGDILFINSYTPHETYSNQIGTDIILIQFKKPGTSDRTLQYLYNFIKIKNVQCYIFKQGLDLSDKLKNYFSEIITEYSEKQASYQYFLNAIVHMIHAVLLRSGVIADETKLIANNNIKRLLPIIEYVNIHYNEQITLEEISKLLHISTAYFSRLFKQTIGSNFTEYLLFVRICKAKHLLKKGFNVSEAAFDVGFTSLSYFDRVFKKYTFCSPKNYKKFYQPHEDFEFWKK